MDRQRWLFSHRVTEKERGEVTDPAFRELFDTHFAYVWSVLRRLGVREADVEDRTHEVFLNVHRKLADYDTTRPIRPWLFGFAFRVASHHRRSEQRRREVFGLDVAVEDPAAAADTQLMKHEERSLLTTALETLNIDQRAVVIMHDWDGEPIPEVARAMGIPLNTAYSRLRHARAALAEAVKRCSKQRGAL